MNNKLRAQYSLGRFVLTVTPEETITFFSIIETPSEKQSKLLMWKHGVGFSARVVKDDPNSDLQISKSIDPEDFPVQDLIKEIRSSRANMASELREQIIALLAGC